jgi:hypothetical protein
LFLEVAGWVSVSAFATSLIASIWAKNATDVWRFGVVFLVLALYLTVLGFLTKEARARYPRKVRLPRVERHFRRVRFALCLILAQVVTVASILVIRGVSLFVVMSIVVVCIVLVAALFGLWRLLRVSFLQEGWRW